MQSNSSRLLNALSEYQKTKKNENKTDTGIAEKGAATLANIGGQLVYGFGKGIEGIVDFGAGVVGSIGGLFDENFKQDVSDFVERDFTKELTFDPQNNWAYNNAYRNDFFDGIAQSVGQMLPSIAVGIATGGASTAVQATSLATFGVGAAGTSTEQALQEGTSLDKATLYGILSGAKEVGTELVGGKILGKIAGTSGKVFGIIGTNATTQVEKTTGKAIVKQFVKDAFEEGFEEALGDTIEPLIQQVYKDGTYAELFAENGGVQGMLEDFAAGALTGGIMGGVSLGTQIGQMGYDNYKLANDLQAIDKLQQDSQDAYFKGNNELSNQLAEQREQLINDAQADLLKVINNYEQLSKVKKLSISNDIQQVLDSKSNLTTKEMRLNALRDAFGINVETTTKNNYYDPNTNTIYVNEEQLSSATKTTQNFIHEYSHSKTSTNLIDTILENTTDYDTKVNEYINRYANVIRESSEYKRLVDSGMNIQEAFNQVAEDYVREEIAADELSTYFKNLNEFKKAVDGANVKGLRRLLNSIRALFRGKRKPSNYSKVIKLLQENIRNKQQESTNTETKYKLKNDEDLLDDLMLDEDIFLEDIDDIDLDYEISSQKAYELQQEEKQMRRENYNALTEEQKKFVSFEKSYNQNYEKLVQKLNSKLSKQAKEYFKNSKLKTKDGLLIPMFHGTPNSQMYFFDSERIGENAIVRGSGFYLTTNLAYAKDYSNPIEYNDRTVPQGKVIISFANITKPLNNLKITIPKETIEKFLLYNNINNINLKEIYSKSSSDADLIENIYQASKLKFNDFFFRLKKNLGYDGVIFWNRAEGTIAIVFNSNQIKDVTNMSPTESRDIRYKLEDNGDMLPQQVETELTTPNNDTMIKQSQELEKILPNPEFVYNLKKQEERKSFQRIWNDLKLNWVNAQTYLESNLAKKLKAKYPNIDDKTARYNAEVIVQKVRTAPKIAENLIERGLVDENGNKIIYGVDEILKSLSQEDYIEFQDYMYHMHNIDRMTVKERIIPKRQKVIDEFNNNLTVTQERLDLLEEEYKQTKNESLKQEIDFLKESITNIQKEIKLRENAISKIKNKPVFGKEYSASYSQKQVDYILQFKDYKTKFPELAQKIYAFNDYILDESVKSGRLSTQERDLFKEYYPHYVPTYRPLKPQSTSGATQNLYTQSYKKAKGSDEPLIALDLQLKRYAIQNIKANAFNDLGTILLYGEYKQPNRIVWEAREDLLQLEENFNDDTKQIVEEKNGEYTLGIMSNGERIVKNINREDYIGLKDMQAQFDPLLQTTDLVRSTLGKMMKLFRSSVTEWNPFFLVRNFARDYQDSLIYTKYNSKDFVRMSKQAFLDFKNRNTSVNFKLFRQYGGFANSQFDGGSSLYESLEESQKINKTKNPMKWIMNKMSLANRAVEMLPRYTEFLLSIEAQKKAGVEKIDYDKAIYDSQEVTLNFGRHGASRWAKDINRYLIPFFNAQIQGASKIGRTFTNFKNKKALALLITKAVLLGFIPAIINGMLYDDDEDYAKLSNYDKDNFYLFKVGNEFVKIPKGRLFSLLGGLINQDNKSLADNLTSAWDTLSPVSSLRTILAPITDAKTNTTWYGGTLVGGQYDNVRPKNQYDNETSYIARGLGKIFNYSPIKIDYLLEQYTGVIGDFVIPIASPKGLSNLGTTVLQPTLNQFLVDPNSSSGYSSKFYNLVQELNYQANEGSLQAKAQNRYLTKMKSYISEIYDEIDSLAESGLSKKEIENQTKVLRGAINTLYKQAIETSKTIRKELDRYDINEDNYDVAYEMALYSVLGAESTMKLTNEDLYNRSVDLNEVGIDYDTYYTYYINTKGFDKDYKTEYIQRMNLSKIQKYILYLVSGYSIPDNVKNQLKNEINNSNMSSEYKETLLEKLN